jgi:hypothetical protein
MDRAGFKPNLAGFITGNVCVNKASEMIENDRACGKLVKQNQ